LNRAQETTAPSIAECREELSSVVKSRTFRQSPRLARLLEYLCSKSVTRESHAVNEHMIGVDVFGKPLDFKESTDSTVRVEMHRLRKRLAAFYEEEGAGHKLRIVVSPGKYATDFIVLHTDEGANAPETGSLLTRLGKRRLILIAVTAAVVTGCCAVAVVAWRAGNRDRTVASHVAAAPLLSDELHFLAGYAGDPWVDSAGRHWQRDRYYQGGIALPGVKELVPPPPDRRLFQTMRAGSHAGELTDDGGTFAYDIPMKPGTYELFLHFADPLRESAQLPDRQDGQNLRHFTIRVNGEPVLNRIDVVADGGTAAVDVRAFKDIRPAADGRVHLQFVPDPNEPFVNALELVPSRPGHANPIRITARPSVYTDAQGRRWGPDDYFVGGSVIANPVPAAAANLPELYWAERYGNFAYAIPVPPGVYSLTLYFAETFFAPAAASPICRGPGCRVFDVSCNGASLLRDFDVFKAAGAAYRPAIRTFHGLRPNGQGKLLVSFSPAVDYGEVRAIEVLDETPEPRTTSDH